MNCAYQGETYDENEHGITSRLVYTGTREELENYMATLPVGQEEYGSKTLSSKSLRQQDGPIWQLELIYMENSDSDVGGRGPSNSFNTRNATLSCSCSTIAIETLPAYRKNWNHYLITGNYASEDGSALRENLVPPFWETADASFVMPMEYERDYRWIKDPAECPAYVGNDQRKWRILCNPTKPGLLYVDRALYRIQETIRCRSASDAGRFAANIVNKITMPQQRFGIKGGENQWKCDSASVSWNGKDWIATLNYVRSCDDKGWDPDLYEEQENK